MKFNIPIADLNHSKLKINFISYLWMFEDGPVHGSASGTSVYCGRWDEGGVRGESQPSQYQRLSKNQSEVQARITQVCL